MARPRSRSMATRSPSMPAGSTRSSIGSPRTRASRPARWPRSPRAESCRGSRSRSNASSPKRTRRRRWSSTRSTPASAAGAPTRSGARLWGLARRHQVLCVTHLPQIAAHADAHFRIAKRERDGRTVTEVERLDREGRIVELAAMLGGGPGDAGALASARELLDRAESWRPAAGRPRAVDRSA